MLEVVINLCVCNRNNPVMDNSIKSKFDYLLMVRYIPSSALFLLPSGKRTPPVSEHLVRQCPFAGGSTVFKAEGQTI